MERRPFFEIAPLLAEDNLSTSAKLKDYLPDKLDGLTWGRPIEVGNVRNEHHRHAI